MEALCVPIAFMSVRYVTINFVTNAIRGGGLGAVLKDAHIVTEPTHLLENFVNSWKIGTQNAIPILLIILQIYAIKVAKSLKFVNFL